MKLRKAIFHAVNDRNIHEIKRLIISGYKPTTQIMVHAVNKGFADAVEFLLKENVFNNSNFHHKCMKSAVFQKKTKILAILLKYGAHPHLKSNCMKSIFSRFLTRNDIKVDRKFYKIATMLLDFGIDLHYNECIWLNPIVQVFERCNFKFIEQYMKCSDLNLSALQKNKYILYAASKNKDLNVLKYLVNSKLFDVNDVNDEGHSILHYPLKLKRTKTVRYLIKHAMDSQFKNNFRHSLLTACSFNFKNGIQMLLHCDAIMNHPFPYKVYHHITILHYIFFKTNNFTNRVKKLLISHIVKLDFMGMPVSDDIFELLNKNDRVACYYNKCEMELMKLQSYITKDLKMFVSLLKGRDNDRYLRNKKFTNLFKCCTLGVKKIFPVYGSLINKIFRKAVKMQKLLKIDGIIIGHITGIDENRLYAINEAIIEYLDKKDLLALVCAYYNKDLNF